MIEDRVEKLQDRIEGNQEAELDDTQASVISEFFTLEELEETELQDNALHEKKSSGTSNSEGIVIANYKATTYRFQKVVLQDAVREVVTRQGW